MRKHERKRKLRKPRHRWEDIRSEIGWDGVDWIHLAQDRPVVGSHEHSNEPSGSIKSWEFLA
jgi:hypothetical protein